MDRDGKKLTYLGGGPSNGVGCACGITSTCRNNAYKCNCDANLAGVWLRDEGYVTDKNVLPLTEIRLGDTGVWNEYGYHTIGKLECTGELLSLADLRGQVGALAPHSRGKFCKAPHFWQDMHP